MPAEALNALRTVLGDVDVLVGKAEEVTGGRRGRPAEDLGPLKRPSIMLCYTAWEVYVEDSLNEVAARAIASETPQSLPESLKNLTTAHVTAKDNDPWDLSGDGWKTALVHAVEKVTRGIGDRGFGGLNTADYSGVNKLQRTVLGERLLGSCRWKGRTPAKIEEILNDLVVVRGAIVHRGETPGKLNLKGVRERQDFIKRLGEAVDREIEAWIDRNLQPLPGGCS